MTASSDDPSYPNAKKEPPMDILIRNVPDSLVVDVDKAAKVTNVSRQQYLLDLLTAHAAMLSKETNLVAGFVRLDARGDVDMDERCSMCGRAYEDAGGQYLMIRLDNRPPSVVCGGCAGDYSNGD
jgi:hypothetical protein